MSKKSYMGYGSPQALEAALNIKDEHIQIIKETLLYTQVCSDLPQTEVVARMAQRISGTSGGWQLSGGIEQGVQCSEKPGFKHYLFEC